MKNNIQGEREDKSKDRKNLYTPKKMEAPNRTCYQKKMFR